MKWTKEEIDYLHSHMFDSHEDVARVLGRNVKSVKDKRYSLGIRINEKEFYFCDDDKNFIADYYNSHTFVDLKELSKIMHRTTYEISRCVCRMKLINYNNSNENARIWSVYIHVNKKNNKKYIGITSMQPHKRWGSNGVYYRDQIFYRAIKKYTWQGFIHEVLFEKLTEKEASEKERQLIKYYKTNDRNYGYNVDKGGFTGGKISEDVKRHLREINIGVNSPKAKKVDQYTLDGVFIKTWDCINDIERELNIPGSNVCACCKGKYKQTHGFIWKYYEEQ